MLSRFFKRRRGIDHPEADVRLEAVDALDTAAQDQFTNLARTDPDDRVRLRALERIEATDVLGDLLGDPVLGDRCAARLAARIDDDHPLNADPRILVARIASVETDEGAASLTSRLSEPAERARALLSIRQLDIRRNAIARLSDEAMLTACEKASRSKDKTANRIARDRLAAYKSLVSLRKEKDARVEEVLASAERTLPSDPHYATRRDAIEREWQALLDDVRSTDEQLAAFDVPRRDLDTLNRRFPKRVVPEPEVETEPKPDARIFLTLAEKLSAIEGPLADIEALEREWVEAADRAAPSADLAAAFHERARHLKEVLARVDAAIQHETRALKLIEPVTLNTPVSDDDWTSFWRSRDLITSKIKQIQSLRAEVDWPASKPAPAWLTQLVQAEEDFVQLAEHCRTVYEDTSSKTDTVMGLLREAIDNGEVKAAFNAERTAHDVIAHLPKNAQSKHRNALNGVGQQLRELRDWQSFAESPKRVDLIEQMQTLATSPLDPPDQNQRVKDLRSMWNALGHPRDNTERVLQKQFNEAAEHAFEPCRRYFAELAEIRAANLQGKMVICEQLEAYVEAVDWDDVNWRTVEQTLRTAQHDWRNLLPVDRVKGKKAEARFAAVTDQVKARLQAAWTASLTAKQAIVDEATAAYGEEGRDLADVVTLMKQLQARWKTTGPAPRREDQKLWHEFRAVCDRVFEDRDKAKDDRHARVDADIKDAEELIAEVRRLVHDSEQPIGNRSPVRQTHEQIAQLDLPARLRDRLDHDLDAIDAEWRTRRRKLELAQKLEQYARVLDLDTRLAHIEDSDPAAAAGAVVDAGELGVDFSKRVESTETDTAELLDTVLQAEILAGIESPADDQPRRMEIQVARLNAGLGGRDDDGSLDVDGLLQRWCAMARGSTALRDRFHLAVKKLIAAQ